MECGRVVDSRRWRAVYEWHLAADAAALFGRWASIRYQRSHMWASRNGALTAVDPNGEMDKSLQVGSQSPAHCFHRPGTQGYLMLAIHSLCKKVSPSQTRGPNRDTSAALCRSSIRGSPMDLILMSGRLLAGRTACSDMLSSIRPCRDTLAHGRRKSSSDVQRKDSITTKLEAILPTLIVRCSLLFSDILDHLRRPYAPGEPGRTATRIHDEDALPFRAFWKSWRPLCLKIQVRKSYPLVSLGQYWGYDRFSGVASQDQPWAETPGRGLLKGARRSLLEVYRAFVSRSLPRRTLQPGR